MNKIFDEAFANHKSGKLTAARDLYEQILKEEPQNHEVWDLLGVLYTQAKQFDKALTCLQKAISIKPSNYYIENIGRMYFEKGDFEKAVEIYEILVKYNPNNYDDIFHLAMSYKNNSQMEQAKETYLKDRKSVV